MTPLNVFVTATNVDIYLLKLPPKPEEARHNVAELSLQMGSDNPAIFLLQTLEKTQEQTKL